MISLVLEESGIDPDRYALEWVSSAEGPRFAEVVTRFTEQIRALGPHASIHDWNAASDETVSPEENAATQPDEDMEATS